MNSTVGISHIYSRVCSNGFISDFNLISDSL
nr:MAG TPA: hypothetical protein [Crassvirales sp.]